jgi:hypothetical protein
MAALAGTVVALALQPAMADALLTGNYLKVGVNNTGGLIDSTFNTGINYDKNGTATYAPYDFLKPGTPYEFYSIGYAGSPGGKNTFGTPSSNSNSYGYYHTIQSGGSNPGSTTTNTSAAGVLSATTTGGAYGALAISQVMSFGVNSGFIDFTVTLTNTSAAAVNNVVYGRGLDPDQDVYAGGGYNTTNTIVSGDLVTGSAPITDWTIGIYSNSAYAHTPTIQGSPGVLWDSNPYDLLLPSNDGYGDYTINMGWNIGTLGAGESATIAFQYRIADTHVAVEAVPDNGSTLGLLGLAMVGFVAFRRKLAA